jgi:adenylate kinase
VLEAAAQKLLKRRLTDTERTKLREDSVALP